MIISILFFSRKVIFFFTLFLFTVLFFPFFTFAAQTPCSWTKTSSGGWFDSTANWSCGAFPNNNTYDVTICNASAGGAITVTATTSLTVGKITVGAMNGADASCNSVAHTLVFSENANLTLDDADGWDGGDLHIGARGIFTAGAGTHTLDGDFIFSGGTSSAGAPRLNGQVSTFVLTNGNQLIDSIGNKNANTTFFNLTIAPNSATTTFGTNWPIAGVLTANGGGIAASSTAVNTAITLSATTTATPFVKGSSYFEPMDFVYSGCLFTTKNIVAGIYSNLTLNPTTGSTCVNATSTLLGNVTVNGTLTLNGSGATNNRIQVLDTGGYNLTVGGTTIIGSGGAVIYYHARIFASGNSILSFNNIEGPFVNCNSCSPSITGGLWVNNGNTIYVSGNWDFADINEVGSSLRLPFNYGTSTVIFNGTSTSQIIASNGYDDLEKFYNLTINNSGADGVSTNYVQFYNESPVVVNNLTLIDGALDLDSYDQATISIGGNLTINNTASTSIIYDPTTFMFFNGTTILTDNLGNFNLGNVYIASSTAAASLTLASSATSTYMHIGSGETLSLGTNRLTFANTSATTTPLAILGTFTPGTGTVTYAGTDHSTIAPTVYYNLISNSAGKANTISASTTVMGTLTNTAGTLVVAADIPYIGSLSNSDTIRQTTGYIINPATSLDLSATSYTAGDTLTITLIDLDGNLIGTTTDSVAGITVTLGADSETVTLTETGNATAIFTGTLPTSASAGTSVNDGTLNVASAGTLTVTYTDPQDATDNAASDTATASAASSGGGGSTPIGAVIIGFLGTNNTLNTTPQTPPTPPATAADPLASIRAIINPIIASLLTGPIQVNTTNTQNRILQFLLAGDKEIYPEGLITGYYGPLTKAAVQRFQLKYNVTTATDPYYGYAGPATRAKIKEVLGK